MKIKKFDRYKFNVALYASTFDFLSKKEKIELAMKLAAVWKQYKPIKDNKGINYNKYERGQY